VETGRFTPGLANEDIRRKFNPHREFVVGYFGTMGAAHGLESVVAAAGKLDGVRLLFVGDGAARPHLQKLADGKPNVTFVDPRPREAMPDLWRLCDLALVQVRSVPAMSMVIPSKIFEAMSSGTAILLAAPEGEASKLVSECDCGVVIESECEDSMAKAISNLRDHPEDLMRMGDNGRRACAAYSRERQAASMLDVMKNALEEGVAEH
jgi:glycosyltransferase involved in cell wall biosynthesis